MCIVCNKAKLKAWRAANADHLKAYNKQNHERWEARPGNAEHHREMARAWYEAHPEQAKATQKLYAQGHKEETNARVRKRRLDPVIRAKHNAETKAWREANAEMYSEIKHRHYEANTERWRAYTRNYRAAKSGNGGKHTPEDIQVLFNLQRGLCHCGVALIISGRGKFHVDHMLPISRGGSNGPENLQLLCQPCNNSKGAKTMDEWLNIQRVTHGD
jgi:5-methylcytosine-specific restriction endonuclease McrA